jgi:hypothetical protein
VPESGNQRFRLDHHFILDMLMTLATPAGRRVELALV